MVRVALDGEYACRVGDLGTDTERTVLVEGIDECLAVVIVVNPGAGANGGFGIRRVSECESRSEVVF